VFSPLYSWVGGKQQSLTHLQQFDRTVFVIIVIVIFHLEYFIKKFARSTSHTFQLKIVPEISYGRLLSYKDLFIDSTICSDHL